jgi:hypothetical protein
MNLENRDERTGAKMQPALNKIRQGVTDRPATILTEESPDFSLVLGGPIYQLFRRTHLSGEGLELLHRRILVITLIAWLPLLILSALGSHLLAPTVKVPFLYDIETHVKLLVALPILIAVELIVHSRIRLAVRAFLARRIVLEQDIPRFNAAIESAMRLRNSVPVELGLILLVYTVGQWIWRSEDVLGTATWYAAPHGGHLHLTSAGYWYAFVSLPIFQFILLRWYLRFFIWVRFLWQTSRLNLHLIPIHPDRAGGLSFLGKSSYAFGPILFVQGIRLAGLIGSHVLYAGANLWSFKMQAAGLIGFFLVFFLGPLTMFTPQLARAKRNGLADYGLLASRYVEDFEQKWVRRNTTNADELLGSGDIQSLADLGNSYAAVREMQLVPFALQDVTRLAVAMAAPLLPLGLTVFSLEELVMRALKIMF